MLTRYYKIFVSLFSMGDFYDLKILTIKQYDIKFPLTSYIEHSNKAHTKVLKTNSKVNGYWVSFGNRRAKTAPVRFRIRHRNLTH